MGFDCLVSIAEQLKVLMLHKTTLCRRVRSREALEDSLDVVLRW